ncbi:uncharacterized protein BDW70DRAFT_164337 [Aspergillus foveolatus]|uniref:uncharacterized protein n=1 Tax=Aspergillus foveolatus TaxID=210207 RepID=UPI003CCD88A0
MALNNFELGTTTSTTASHVFCAVNLFNQPDVYRLQLQRVMLRHEQGPERDVAECWYVLEGPPGYSRCKVNFVGSQYADHPTPGRWSKRDGEEPTNEHGGWEIESIEMDPDEDMWWPLPEDIDWDAMLGSNLEDMKQSWEGICVALKPVI